MELIEKFRESSRDILLLLESDKGLRFSSMRDPNVPTLGLRPEYHQHIEQAYHRMIGGLIECDLEQFRGILVKGEFCGKVQIASASTVSEMKLWISEMAPYINASRDPWKRATNLFLKPSGEPMTPNSFHSAKIEKIRKDREEYIKEIVSIFDQE